MAERERDGQDEQDEHDDVVCQVLRGTLDAAVVLRTDAVVAFLDIHPLFKGHTLVSPVRHVDTLLELREDEMVPLWGAAQRIARAQTAALGAQGTFVAVNNVVSQSVPHLHVHVVPRTRGDGLRGFFWPRKRYVEGERDAYAALLREALAD